MNYSIKCTNQDNIITFNSLLAQTQITYTRIEKYPVHIDTTVAFLNGVSIVRTTFI
jgi:N-dimethylarginine dimethylaminohydrolase